MILLYFLGRSDHPQWNKIVVETSLHSVRSIVKLFESGGHLNVSSTVLQTCVDSLVELIDGNILPLQAHDQLLELSASFLHVLATKIVLNKELNCVSTFSYRFAFGKVRVCEGFTGIG